MQQAQTECTWECYEAELQLVFVFVQAQEVWEMELWHEMVFMRIIHMAAPKLQLWILISALCACWKNLRSPLQRRNWLPFSTPRNILSFLLETLSFLCSFLAFNKAQSLMRCNIYQYCEKPHVFYISNERTNERVMLRLEICEHELCWKIENCRKLMQFWCSHIINKGFIFIMAWFWVLKTSCNYIHTSRIKSKLIFKAKLCKNISSALTQAKITAKLLN